MILLTTLHVLGTIQKVHNDVIKVKRITNEANITVWKINNNLKEVKQSVKEDHGKYIFILSQV